MTLLPDNLAQMTASELAEWLDTAPDGALGELFRTGTSVPPAQAGFTVLPDRDVDAETGTVPMKVTSFRLPAHMIEELGRVAGRDRDGRSGIVREALSQYLSNLRRPYLDQGTNPPWDEGRVA